MKGFAIYTCIIMGFVVVGVLSEPSADGMLGMLMCIPTIIWSIMVIARGATYNDKKINTEK